MGGLSIWHWLIVLVVVILIFGTKKLKNIGSDLGGAVKGFKDGLKDGSSVDDQQPNATTNVAANVNQQAASISNQAQATSTVDKNNNTIDVEAKIKS